MSLVGFAHTFTPSDQRRTIRNWMREHQDVQAEIEEGQKFGPVLIYRWLREEHDFPFSLSGFYTWKRETK